MFSEEGIVHGNYPVMKSRATLLTLLERRVAVRRSYPHYNL